MRFNEDVIVDAKIRMDGSGDKTFRRNFQAYLRTQLNSAQKKMIKDCKFLNSKENVLVQMADMVAGAIHRARDDKRSGHDAYLDMISSHVKSQWDYPNKKSSQ